MVSSGSIYAKIDRPAKLVSFHRPLSPEDVSDFRSFRGNVYKTVVRNEDNTVSDKPNTNTYSLYEINSTVMNDEQTVPSEKVSNFNSLDENDKIKYCCLSLLSLFFAGNFTQEGLRLIISHLQNFIDFAIPKSFDRLTNKIDSRPLPYDKVWFCDFCDTIIDLKSCYQRNCHLCVHATK